MKLGKLIEEIEHDATTGPRDCEVLGIVCDSRQVRPGYLFAAIPGRNQDGWSFIDDAIQRGAIAILSEHDGKIGRDVSHIRVTEARRAIAELACVFAGKPSDQLQIIGITGTNGKTTTAYMLRDILRATDQRPGLLSTVEYEIGARVIPATQTTPDAPILQSMLAQMVNAGCKSAVIEISSHALDQQRTAGIEYEVAVFTNLTHEHLDYHETMERYFEAKSRLFLELGKQEKRAAAVINTDDEWGLRLSQSSDLQVDVVSYGVNPQASVRAEEIELTPSESTCRVLTPWGNTKIRIHLPGRFNISNALAAVASCGALGIEIDLAARALSEMALVPGRLEEIRTRKGFQVFVDYAHTDDALEHVLKTLREIARKRLIVVFGCGGNRDKTKRPAMGRTAARLADFSILTADNPRHEDPSAIIADICEGFGSAHHFEVVDDRREAITRALDMAGKGDVVLIAGKGHENFQEFDNTMVPFDDREVVKKILDG